MKNEDDIKNKVGAFMMYASRFNLWPPGGPNGIKSSPGRNQNQHIYIYYLSLKKEYITSIIKTKEETKVPMPRTINAKTQ